VDQALWLARAAMKSPASKKEGRIGTGVDGEGSKPVDGLDFALLTGVAARGEGEPIADPDDLARPA